MNLLEKFCNDAKNNPDRKLYDFMDCSTDDFAHSVITIKDAWEKARDIAYELRTKGAKKGDIAIILSLQDAGTVYAVWGCMLAGVTFTVLPPPIDPGKVSRLISVLKSCSPKFLISNEGMEKTQKSGVKGELLKGALKQVLTLKRVYTDKIDPHPEFTDFSPLADEDLVYLQYTSGSTSEPKGVMVTHRNITSCLGQCQEIFDYTKGHYNLCSWVPFYHNIGLIVAIILPTVLDEGISYFIPTLQFLAKPSIWLKAMSDYKINITAAPNSAYEVITQIISKENAAKYDLQHVLLLINGSEFVDANTVKKFCELFNISENAFAPGYGLSECVCVASLSCQDFRKVTLDTDEYRNGNFVPSENGDKTVVGVGRLASDMTVKVVDKDGAECAPGKIGEIYLQSPSVCVGYYKNPEETKRFHAHVKGIEVDFFSTGDMGYIHEGNVFLTGRIKEMIVISGRNLFPYDIVSAIADENIGLKNDGMAVFSIKHEGIEAPILCAEIKQDITDEEAASIMSKTNQIVSNAFGFTFRDILLVENGYLPRTDNRKIKTIETKNRYKNNNINARFSLLNGKSLADEGVAARIIIPPISTETTLDEIKNNLKNIFAQYTSVKDFTDNDSFLDLGADSLTMTSLVTALEEGAKVSIDLRRLIEDASVNGISEYLYSKLHPDYVPSNESEKDLYKECILPEHLKLTGEYDKSPAECKNIFLTGATGFLGAYTIAALINEHGSKGIKIYAHARAKDKAAAKNRIIDNLKRFNCYKPEYMDYIEPVIGELTKPFLGIEKSEYDKLANCVDMIIHNGAVLNFLLSYNKLKDANVTGTVAALELAMTGKPKYFSYISSYSVYDNPSHFKKHESEDDAFSSADGYFLGYSETKWVSEKLVQAAAKKGLRTVVFRPGDITGTMQDGIWKLEDLISRSIVGCIQLKALPDMNVHLHLTPVDYVAECISHIAFSNESVGHGFNIINNLTRPMSEINLFMKKYGYKVSVLPYDKWCELLVQATPEENVLRVLSCLFTDKKPEGENLNERFGDYQATFSTENCDRLMADTGIKCPPMSEKMLVAYLKNFSNSGLIPAPRKWYQRLFK